MPTAKFLALAFFVLFSINLARTKIPVKPTPCPFNELECNCTETDFPSTFDDVVCESASASLPSFNPPAGTMYVVKRLTIRGNVYDIPAHYFLIFTWIFDLVLEQTKRTPDPIFQKWNGDAFDYETTIINLRVKGLAGVIPPPPSLIHLGQRSLYGLYVSDVGTPIRLSDNAFNNFSALTNLWIEGTEIDAIADFAFSGLESQLVELRLAGASLTEFPSKAISKLNNLSRIALDDNAITELAAEAISPFANLKTLSLSGNKLGEAVLEGALDDLPSSLSTLELNNVDLKIVPGRILKKHPGVTSLDLKNNQIQTIKKDDLVDGDHLTFLYLNSNPISNIDNGAFSFFETAAIDLSNSSLTSVDLSVFANNASGMKFILDDSSFLKTITVSDVDKLPHIFDISMKKTGLEIIDQGFEELLAKRPSANIDISNNVHLVCKDLGWLAYYVSCIANLKIDGAKCADESNKSLADYLKSTPNPTCPSSTASTTKGASNAFGRVSFTSLAVALVALYQAFMSKHFFMR